MAFDEALVRRVVREATMSSPTSQQVAEVSAMTYDR